MKERLKITVLFLGVPLSLEAERRAKQDLRIRSGPGLACLGLIFLNFCGRGLPFTRHP